MADFERRKLAEIIREELPPQRCLTQIELRKIHVELQARILRNKVLRKSLGVGDQEQHFTFYYRIHPIGLSRIRECVQTTIIFVLGENA